MILARKKKAKKVKLNKYHISISLICLSAFFFFLKYTATTSIMYTILSGPVQLAYWEMWTTIFYAWLFIIAILVFLNEDLLRRWIFKKLFIFMFLIATILNFPFLENDTIDIQRRWWRIWYLWIFIWSKLLWNQTVAVKWFYMWMLAIVLLWIWFTLDLHKKTPKLKFELDEPTKEKETKSNKKEEKQWSFIKDTLLWFLFKPKEKVEYDYEEEQDDEIIQKKPTKKIEENKPTDKAVLRNMLEAKLKKKVDENESKKILTLHFSNEKPTFDINLLDESENPESYKLDEAYLDAKVQSVVDKLNEFGIDTEPEWYNTWPTVIQLKIKPKSWIRVSQIESLSKDLALALKTKSLRVIAPIPGTDSVWIEIPHPKPSIVRIRDILWSKDFAKGMTENFTNLSLGKRIDWDTIIKSLEKMPHLLVAWATGAWKSVWINDFIISLIYQNSPSELKFIMVDPKQVELWIYEWIPYLLSPIITEPEKALKVLKWATIEMDSRYSLLKNKKVRNIDEYNEKMEKNDDKMYKIVIIIDELADLMMSWNKKDTENAIARIAQKARAVWIHLIVATQRPSVNVITWLIKANIPTRIAFWVVSQIDSRTILDVKWAEDLVWKWDLLYIDPNSKFPIRIQAPYVSTAETEKVVEEIKRKYMKWIDEKDIYHPEIVSILESKAEYAWWEEISWDDEELVQQAIQIIIETQKASATMLQRKLWIWFPRAARIIDILEQKWIVWPQEWAKPREIMVR